MFLFFRKHELILVLLLFEFGELFSLLSCATVHAKFDPVTGLEALTCFIQTVVVAIKLIFDDGILSD